MLQFSPNSTIALVGSSDGLPRGSDAVPRLCAFLESLGLRTVVFPSLYQTAAGTPQPAERRAADIQAAFASPKVDAVFDLTGGDGANVVLPHLDLRKIAHTPKPFFGYSDVSALLNPLQFRSRAGVLLPATLSGKLPCRRKTVHTLDTAAGR
ncbi:MAG: LD-carboxypeptidase [Ruminococcus sp.]